MPFKSQAQRRFMYSQHPEMAKKWEKHTPKGKKLPEKVSKESEIRNDFIDELNISLDKLTTESCGIAWRKCGHCGNQEMCRCVTAGPNMAHPPKVWEETNNCRDCPLINEIKESKMIETKSFIELLDSALGLDIIDEKKDGKWIQKAIKKPGQLHKDLGVPKGEKIPAKKLDAAAKKGGKVGQRANLAKNLKNLNK